MELVSTLKELLHLHPLYNEQLKSFAAFGGDFHDASRLVDMGASITSASDAQLQAIIEQLSILERCGPLSAPLKSGSPPAQCLADSPKLLTPSPSCGIVLEFRFLLVHPSTP